MELRNRSLLFGTAHENKKNILTADDEIPAVLKILRSQQLFCRREKDYVVGTGEKRTSALECEKSLLSVESRIHDDWVAQGH